MVCQADTPSSGQNGRSRLTLVSVGVAMRIEDYRKSLPGTSTRVAFSNWLNGQLNGLELQVSVGYLRELESGRRIPSLPLAIGIEKVTGGVVSVREWPGLTDKLRT